MAIRDVASLFCLGAALAISGCATEAKYEAKLNTWVDQDELKLIRLWGPPERVYESGDSKFLQYSFSNSLFLPGTPSTATTNLYGNTAYTTINPGVPAQRFDYVCATTFEIKSSKITGWSTKGNGCVSE